MYSIKLERVGDKLKIITPYHDEFIEKARELHGKWEAGAWWLDDSAIDFIRPVMLKLWNSTGEEPYSECILLIKGYSASMSKAPIYLFGRKIAASHTNYGRPSLGRGIVFISGICRSAGTTKYWETQLSDATFEIHHFPASGRELKKVKQAIEEGWCEVKLWGNERTRESVQAEIKEYELMLDELQKELNSLR